MQVSPRKERSEGLWVMETHHILVCKPWVPGDGTVPELPEIVLCAHLCTAFSWEETARILSDIYA